MLRRDPASFTRTAKILHWGMAVALVVMLAFGWGLELVPEALRGPAYMLHKACGVALLLLTAARVGWRVAYNAPSLPPYVRVWEHAATKIGHAVLYLAMFAVPLTGWAMVSAKSGGAPINLFGLWAWPALPVAREWGDVFSEAHEISAFFLAVLAAGHVAAALWHHFVWRDFILIRMAPKASAQRLLRLRGE